MKFEDIIADVTAGRTTTEQVFTKAKYARRAWPEGDYLGILPNPSHAARPILAILRDEPWGAISRNWATANDDRAQDDWYEVTLEKTK